MQTLFSVFGQISLIDYYNRWLLGAADVLFSYCIILLYYIHPHTHILFGIMWNQCLFWLKKTKMFSLKISDDIIKIGARKEGLFLCLKKDKRYTLHNWLDFVYFLKILVLITSMKSWLEFESYEKQSH